MILYAVKINICYLRDRGNGNFQIVAMDKASVFPDINKTADMRDRFGEGKIVRLILKEDDAE